MSCPNIVFVFADQWRGQSFGYAGCEDIKTPNIDALAAQSVNFSNAVSGCPVCTPYRASLMTGQYPHTHGLFVNDVCLGNNAVSIAQAYKNAGYDTAYIGKWHIDGHGRSDYIPPERRQGFDYWRTLECTHSYNDSVYYAGDSDEKLKWDGYDAFAQTRDAQDYIRKHDSEKPFLLMLSWGPPHAPYQSAPEKFRQMYNPEDIQLRPNVPSESESQAREDLAGYYAHCSALDSALGELRETIAAEGLEDNTIFVFTSDHGDMLGSQGHIQKQRPWDESIRVPLLIYNPAWSAKWLPTMIDAPDIMPTLLGLSGIKLPDTVEGEDFSSLVTGQSQPPDDSAALLSCMHPFGQWDKNNFGGKEYRGLRTQRYTYVRDLSGPWLLYDNLADQYQMNNLVEDEFYLQLCRQFDRQLEEKLDRLGDKFLDGMSYIKQWGYRVDENGTVPYKW